MNAAANLVPLATPLFVQRMERARLASWRGSLERFLTATGARPTLVHIAPADWIQHYAANEDPVSAALSELARVAD